MSGGTPSKPPATGGAMSLYANLLDPKAATGGLETPAAKKTDEPGGSKKPLDPAMLRFQPMRRPQPTQKPKPKTTFVKAAVSSAPATSTPGTGAEAPSAPATAATPTTATQKQQQQQQPPRSKLSDWAATEEDEYTYGVGGRRERGGRKAKKKNNRHDKDRQTDWDELYDPARPTNVEEYLRSDERIAEIREWKAMLYAHRRQKDRTRKRSRSRSTSGSDSAHGRMSNKFAPPPQFSFAPPPPSPPARDPEQPQAAAAIPDDPTGDDAYVRRLALSGGAAGDAAHPLQTAAGQTSDPGAATISRAPVRYQQPRSPEHGDEMDLDGDSGGEGRHDRGDDGDDDGGNDGRPGLGATSGPDAAPRSSRRPGQAGFAARMMEKMGWEKGQGLGADGSGITTGLSVKVERRRRRPDSEGGGFADPANVGRIVGGHRPAASSAAASGAFGPMSQVVVLSGMLQAMEDVAGEVSEGLAQEIGEECGEKYGRVERLYIDVESRRVFIKFTDQISALRAVNALQGRIFNGGEITPKFYDAEKFEQGVYE